MSSTTFTECRTSKAFLPAAGLTKCANFDSIIQTFGHGEHARCAEKLA